MKLRVLDFHRVSALRSQAVYHGIAETITETSDPVLCLVSPETPYVCVGMHQEIGKEVDEAFCAEKGIPIYRRHVGGGAVYLDENQLFTHFIYPRRKVPEFAINLYPMFIEPVVRTYQALGVNASYRPINDIQVDGRKIGGTGAASIGEATLMVGSFMYDFDTATMARCLKVPSEKFRDKLRQTLDDYMTTMAKELPTPPERAKLKALFLANCADVLGVEPVEDQPTAEEWAAIERAEVALTDPAWTNLQGRKLVELGVKISEGTHLTESMHKAPGGLIRVHLLGRDGKIGNLMISGDFTCLPPDGVDRLTTELTGVELSKDAIAEAAEAAMKALHVEMPGVSGADLATAVMAAAETSN
ncbi:lipoate protein ligase C-terminal domain-containing protein [Hoeflea sp.]|uniref:lipoyl protein ligase domain-containing protein n=1 Tax=Hoeflea sp. TaxID=1940281 RepID=UPI0019B1C1A2|nr:lipoate protein ligase C-terminal domain-containing protein [Hoeflea sp.]MBC7281432.1 lipoate--protein ligase family protein [Hoeflea sp.]